MLSCGRLFATNAGLGGHRRRCPMLTGGQGSPSVLGVTVEGQLSPSTSPVPGSSPVPGYEVGMPVVGEPEPMIGPVGGDSVPDPD